MNCARTRTLLLLAAAVAATGCDPVQTSAIGENEIAANEIAADEPADPDDPFGACEVVGGPTEGLIEFRCSQGGVACTGWGAAGGCNEIGCYAEPFNAICDHHCETDADCPVPETGDVEPVCHTGVRACQLPCGPGDTCPDGFTCKSTAEWGLSHESGPIPPPFQCMQTLEVEYLPAD